MVVPVGVLFGDRSLMRKFHVTMISSSQTTILTSFNYGPTDTRHTSVVSVP